MWRRWTSANAGIAAAATLLLLGSLALGDLIPVADGYGYDGMHYGRWVKRLSLDVLVADESDRPNGVEITSYNVQRVLPSLALHHLLSAADVEPTKPNVIAAFRTLNIVMIVLGVYWWCRAADVLQVDAGGKWLGALMLVVNFANLKMPVYYPALTDSTAFGIGAGMLLLYMRGRTVALLALAVVGAFVWPTLIYSGALLVAFPRDEQPGDQPAPNRLAMVFAVAGSLVGVAYAAHLLQTGYTAPSLDVPPMLLLSPLSLAILGAYLYLAIRGLLDSGRLWEDIKPWRVVVRPWVWAACAGLATAELLRRAVPAQASVMHAGRAIADNFLTSVTEPGVFFLAHVLYYGPMLLVLPFFWPRVATLIRRQGTGLIGFFLLTAILAAGSESRKLINVFPFVVLFVVAASAGWFTTPLRRLGFAAFAVVSSKVWLPMSRTLELPGVGSLDWLTLYRSSQGPYMDYASYWIQLTVALAMGLVVWSWCRHEPSPESSFREQ